MFVFTNIDHATVVQVDLQFQVNATDDDGGDYDVSLITSTSTFAAAHGEDGTGGGVTYYTGHDKAQAATFQNIGFDSSNGAADDGYNGIMHLFSPASTTYVKHFYSRVMSSRVDEGYIYCRVYK